MDLYTLAVSIDPTGILTGSQRGGAALDQLGAHAEGAQKKLDRAGKEGGASLLKLGESASKLSTVMRGLAAATGAGFIGAKLIGETIEAQHAMSQLTAAVQGTHGAAGLTVKQLDDLSASLQGVSTYSDDAVKGAESVLLTFRKVKGENFTDATKAIVDLAARMGTDLSSSALQVGKALQDPEEGLSALTRAGITFSEAQRDTIKQLAATGHEAEAQRLILAQLQSAFGGSAAAAKNTLGGALKGLANDFGDLFEVTEQGTSGAVGAINTLAAGVRTLKDNTGALTVAGEALALVIGARYVAGFLEANKETIALRESVLRGNSVMLDSVEAQRGAAAAAVQRAQAQRTASAEIVANLERERAAIREAQIAERQRLASSTARVAAAVPSGQLAPLGGRAVAREEAAVAFAMKERAAAQAQLISLSQAAAASDAQLAAANEALAVAEAEATLAGNAQVAVMARTTLAARAAAGATAALGEAMALLGGPIGVAVLAAVALNAALDHWIDKQQKAAELTEAQQSAYEAAVAKAHARAAAQKEAADKAVAEAEAIKRLSGERQGEIDKLTALNGAYGQSALSIQLLTIRRDAMLQKQKDATEHSGAELAALNRLTDAMQRQQEIAAVNAANQTIIETAQENIKASNDKIAALRAEVDESQRMYDATLRGKDAVEALTVAMAGEHAARELEGKAMPRQIEQARQLAEQKERLAIATQHAKEAQQKLNDEIKAAGDAVVEQIKKDQERWKAEGALFDDAIHQMQKHFGDFLAGIFTQGISSFADLFKRIKDMFLTMIADMLAASFVKKIAGVVAGLLGNLIPATATGQDGKPIARSGMLGLGSTGMSRVGAGLAGFGIGYATQDAGLGVLGGAASGYAIAGPVGAAVGALSGLVGGLMGSSKAAREAAHQQELLRTAYENTQRQIKAMLSGDTLDLQLAQAKAQFDQYREQARQAAGPGADFLTRAFGQSFADTMYGTSVQNIAYQQGILNQQEQEYIEHLKQEAALKAQQRTEDLQVRLLAAQGHQEEADALALANAQAREYAQYVKEGADPATLALLQQVQAQEKLAAATKQASSAALNMVSGYRLQAAVYRAMAAGGGAGMPSPTFSVPSSPTFARSGSDTASGDLVVPVTLDGKVIATAVLKDFRRRAGQQLGNSTDWSKIQQ